jgi:hypothetical protein
LLLFGRFLNFITTVINHELLQCLDGAGKNRKLTDLSLPVLGLYLLAAPSIPDEEMIGLDASATGPQHAGRREQHK